MLYPILMAIESLVTANLSSAANPKIDATATEITASELASALGVQWWNYRLRFEKAVSSVSVRPCELRRRRDGTWERTYLTTGVGDFSEKNVREKVVSLVIPNAVEGDKYTLKVGNGLVRSQFDIPPDFRHTFTTSKKAIFIEDCLILAFEEKVPTVITACEDNFVRVIGLEIKTDD